MLLSQGREGHGEIERQRQEQTEKEEGGPRRACEVSRACLTAEGGLLQKTKPKNELRKGESVRSG